MRVITEHDKECNTLIVRQYIINDDCQEVSILASGDIKYNNVQLNAKSGGTVEKFCKRKKPIGLGLPIRTYNVLRHPIDNYKNHKYGKIKDGPIPIESTPVSGYIEAEPEVKFWDREKKMVQNAFICSQVRRFVKTKGSLISGSFSNWLKPPKKVPNYKPRASYL